MKARAKLPIALTIAGSDPGGGAGIQADLKTFAAIGVYGYSALTMLIAQNSRRVTDVEIVSPAMVVSQLETLAEEARPAAVKTGAMGNARLVKVVARAIERLKLPAPVVDPVIVSSAGARMLDPKGVRAMRRRLIPLARIVTPNIPEAESLAKIKIDSPAAMRKAAKEIVAMGAKAVVIKGGHGSNKKNAVDLLYDGRKFVELTSPRIPGGGAHGTGCAFAAAIAAYLARGYSLEAAVRAAKRFITNAIAHGFRLGKGQTVLAHFARR
ncbi:MAG TPA: bifunctional hydroxymethylpyrimidine kinase/phosphomethylpyrimidine kinase [Candidatus Binataceae bacterium]|nr:bifunctional hydroxymethylpyrimidine kinase/phosphomethylpyrimidine kinase [Candidatus Binataceae bacterium]